MADPLEALAARAQDDPFFLASPLAAYAGGEGLDDAGLAAALGCSPGDLVMLRLCRAPHADSSEFWEDVSRVAERFAIDPRRLAGAVKRGRVLLRLRAAGAQAGLQAAARDHDPDPPPEES